VGIYVFHSSRNAYRELAEVQRAASSSGKSPAALFDDYDADRNGTLDTCELAKLTSALGSPLSLNELESALVILDRDGSGKVEKSEFLAWFSAAKV
jgi:Ca2+-binding EF-hand superfamily protein